MNQFELSDPAAPASRQRYHDSFYQQQDDRAGEGQLFRHVLVDALSAHGMVCDILVDNTLAQMAAKGLGRTAAAMTRAVAAQ